MSRIARKFIQNNAINGDKLRFGNSEYFRIRNDEDTADVNAFRLNGDNEFEFGVQPKFTGTPSANNDLVNVGYVLDAVAGLRDPKDAVRVATTADIDLTTGGLLTIDGVTVSEDDRVLVKNQGDAEENGIYLAKTGAWVRSPDADSDEKVTQGLSVISVEGTANGQRKWLLTTADPIEVGTTGLTFVEIPNIGAPVQFKREKFELDATDISNGYVDLQNDSEEGSVVVYPFGGPIQHEGEDYTLSTVSEVTRVTFAGTLAAELEDGDDIVVQYAHF